MHFKAFFLFLVLHFTATISSRINVGALFENTQENDDIEKALRYAITELYPQNKHYFITPITGVISENNSFEALLSACNLLDEGMIAFFGPIDVDNINAIQSLCDEKEIPHIIARYNHRPAQPNTVINFFPHAPILSKAYVNLVEAWEWKTFTLFYEDNESLVRVADFLKTMKDKGVLVNIKKLDINGDGIYRTSLREARITDQRNFVIDCKIEILSTVLLHAQQIGLMTPEYNFFITNLDMQTLDLDPVQHCEANITGIRIVSPEDILVNKIISFLYAQEDVLSTVKVIPSQMAFFIDAAAMLIDALSKIPKVTNSFLENIGCNSTKSFIYGTTLLNIIKGSEYQGLTGKINFDIEGFRSYFELEVIGLHEKGISKIGIWNSKYGLQTVPKQPQEIDEDPESLRNRTFTVITCLTEPYGMLKETAKSLYGNNRFEGFGIDLIHELSLMEGFNYTFIIRHDKKNGVKDPETGRWSGMIGDLQEFRADLAITDLTITSGREEAVDFTSPFMNLGISILAQKPGKAPPSFFSFADPFALETWGMLGLAYIAVALSLFIIGRICPAEWQNPYPCIEEPEYLVNQFSLLNSGWFAIGSLMQQGTEIAPIAIATRMVAGLWWFFVLILVSSYTANLAAFLTTESPTYMFKDLKSLVENAESKKIRYGAKAGGATYSFFKDADLDSNGGLYRRVAEHMDSHPEDMVTDNKDAVSLAENTLYAFFMESTSIEYEIQRHCNLEQYGGLLDDKGYGIAMRKNSTYRKRLSTAILKLQASGVIASLKRKWWEERKGGGQCSGGEEGGAATPLNLQNVQGVFYVTIAGVICSICSVLMEMLVYTAKFSNNAKISYKEALKIELHHYFNFNSNSKPTYRSISKSKSPSEEPQDDKDLKNSSASETEPDPYGFKLTISKERLTNSSSL